MIGDFDRQLHSVGLILLAGCSRQGTRYQDFNPPSDKARRPWRLR